jgi:transposase
MARTAVEVTVGVDTHRDAHVAAAVDAMGRALGTIEVTTDRGGYRRLELFAGSFGEVVAFGIEGTGAYGAGLARFLTERGHSVIEVDRPDRKARRHQGKSDPVDALAAALAVVSGRATTTPKSRDGAVEALRALNVARRSATRSRTQATNQLRCLVTTAPDRLRERLRNLTLKDLVATCASFRVVSTGTTEEATRFALRTLARRIISLTEEIAELEEHVASHVRAAAPALLELKGVGTQVAASLLAAVGDNPERLTTEASFAHLCGVAPIPASSGQRTRHRLNRGGDRQANNALWRIVMVRLSCDERTKAYVDKRTAEGRTKREIIRCLKRYVAREVYHCLTPN